MNIVTNANVDVQPYAFTTKSLFIGHLDYNYVRWQVIDTPGILDHPLEDRNTIEMTAITALAHLPAAVLFFVDISEMCGYRLDQQVSLFHSIKPLFRNRPLLIILNKTDLRKVDSLSPEEKKLIDSMKDVDHDGAEVQFIETSCATKLGVDNAQQAACDLLLTKRVEQKVKAGKAETLHNRLHVTSVAARTDRPPCIPTSVMKARGEDGMGDDTAAADYKSERQRMEELGGAGVYSVDMWRRAILEDKTWKYDVVPEIMDGHNVIDFIDPDIEKQLEALEREEYLLMKEAKIRNDEGVLSKFQETQDVLDEMHSRIRQRKLENRLNKSRCGVTTPRKAKKKAKEVVTELKAKGMDGEKVVRGRSSSVKRTLTAKRKRDSTAGEDGGGSVGRDKSSATRGRSHSMNVMKGLATPEAFQQVEKKRRKSMRKLEKHGKQGESDRHIPDLKPKHLYSGKRGIGKTDRR